MYFNEFSSEDFKNMIEKFGIDNFISKISKEHNCKNNDINNVLVKHYYENLLLQEWFVFELLNYDFYEYVNLIKNSTDFLENKNFIKRLINKRKDCDFFDYENICEYLSFDLKVELKEDLNGYDCFESEYCELKQKTFKYSQKIIMILSSIEKLDKMSLQNYVNEQKVLFKEDSYEKEFLILLSNYLLIDKKYNPLKLLKNSKRVIDCILKKRGVI